MAEGRGVSLCQQFIIMNYLGATTMTDIKNYISALKYEVLYYCLKITLPYIQQVKVIYYFCIYRDQVMTLILSPFNSICKTFYSYNMFLFPSLLFAVV